MFESPKFVSAVAKNTFQEMSREELELYALRLRNKTGDGRDTFTGMLDNQQRIQREHFGFDCDDFSLTELATKIMETKQHLDDEITEVLTALGGDYGKAAWKHWKADHKKCSELCLDDLEEHLFEEVTGEVADVMIFAMNIAVQCGVNGYELAQAIAEKQAINEERQTNGY